MIILICGFIILLTCGISYLALMLGAAENQIDKLLRDNEQNKSAIRKLQRRVQ